MSLATSLHTYSGWSGQWAEGFMWARRPWSKEDLAWGQCTHHEYYKQFVTADMLYLVAETIGVKRLTNGCKLGVITVGTTDEWYSMMPYFHDLYIEYPGLDHRQNVIYNFTLSDCICILKAAGVMIAEDDSDIILVPSKGLLTDKANDNG